METSRKILAIPVLIAAVAATYYTAYMDFQPTPGLFGALTEPIYIIGITSIILCIIFVLSNSWVINKKPVFKKNKLVYTVSLLAIFGVLIGEWFRTF